jgi:hypothetical protein
MENPPTIINPKSNLKFAASIILIIILICGVIYYFFTKSNKKATDTSNNTVVETKLAEPTELSVLEGYFIKNELSFPLDYVNAENYDKRVKVLKQAVIEREVNWKSGAVVLSNWTDENKEEARTQTEKYRDVAASGIAMSDMFTKMISDKEFVKYFNADESGYFGPITREKNVFPNQEVFNDFWAAKEGFVSNIFEIQSTKQFAFFAVTRAKTNGINTYKDWLKSASDGQIDESN